MTTKQLPSSVAKQLPTLITSAICQVNVVKKNIWQIDTDKQSYIIKQTAHARLEVNALSVIANANCFKTPPIVFYNASLLCLERIAATRVINWQHFAFQLAKQHHITRQIDAGYPQDNYFVNWKQENTWQQQWSTFFVQQRWQVLIETISDSEIQLAMRKLTPLISQRLEQVTTVCLLHGDCWQENILCSDAIYLIDPCCFYGSREYELVYLEFTGCHPAMFDYYHAKYPIEKSYFHRRPVYLAFFYGLFFSLYGNHYRSGLIAIMTSLLKSPTQSVPPSKLES